MRKLLQSLGISVLVMLPAMTTAVSTYDDYDYASDSSAISVALAIGFMLFAFIAGLIGLAMFVFWLVMFVDLVKRDFDQKVLWVILMLLFGFWAALFYYFMIKKKNVTSSK